ncbi:sugar phosphate isomerase/epimerase [Christensenellaceae bacterium NSJ-44]|uniref:Sugar phosphate isomerase/epimerase n=1 Tax=Luoshenia tenuis TaxID=2763654 RepID=A0A926D1B2_9FIRM|nr:sugar phosphate isomerase/epimerase [Luoshenia tenuis]MBC8529928.1 sugar phosphate isomerase/epimerase [Luoshenia tenuis]
MQVGLSTASFYPLIYNEQAVEEIGRLGIRDCEIFLSTYSEYTKEFGEELYRRVRHWGLRVHNVHTLSTQFEPQLFARVPRQRADALGFFRRVLAIGQRLGAENYVFHGPANLKRTPVIHYNYPFLGERIGELCQVAAEYGMAVAWENVHWCQFCRPEFAAHILEVCDHPGLKFTLDIKQAMQAGCDPLKFIPAMGKRLNNVHLCDFESDGTLRLPGEGGFDFGRLKAALDGAGYKGPLLVEVYASNYQDYAQLGRSVQRMREIFCPGD